MKISNLIFVLSIFASTVLISGCSDDPVISTQNSTSSGSTNSSTSLPSSLTLSLTLKDGPAATDNNISSISADRPGFITLLIVDEKGVAVENQIATLTTVLGSIIPSTVLTDSTGKAQAKLEFQSNAGTGADGITVSATLSDNSNTFSTSKNYAVVPPSIQMGDNSGGAFISGQLKLGVTTLSAGGTTSVSAYIVNANEQAFSTPIDVTFKTICASLATPLAIIDQTVSTSSGIASTTYQANGCIGDDIITATAQFGGAEFSSSSVITVASDVVGSIKFVSATPATITLKGAGGAGLQETSQLRFQVVGSSGQPLKDKSVTFSVNGNAGGLTFSPATSVSNANGEVFTVVQAGSIPLVVNVIATVDSTGITTQSTNLVISAGLPDDDSFTLSADKFNPEALRYNGETVNITVQLADIFNNPPATGTPVFFTTEGGSIGASCSTNAAGSCSVGWKSGNPRPADNRATVLAYTQGVESFTDENGDGRFSDTETFTDLPEVFRDDNENLSHDAGEYFVDFDPISSPGYDGVDGRYNGNLCSHPTLCSAQTSLNISRRLVIVFSDSFANISALNGATILANQTSSSQSVLDVKATTPASAVPQTVTVLFSDTNGQSLPIGTTINVSSEAGTLGGTTTFTQPDSSFVGTNSFAFSVKDSNTNTNNSGRLTITVKTPKNNLTEIFFTVNE